MTDREAFDRTLQGLAVIGVDAEVRSHVCGCILYVCVAQMRPCGSITSYQPFP